MSRRLAPSTRAANAVVCVDCERIALLRGSQNLGDRLSVFSRRRRNETAHLVDRSGFAIARRDSLFFTYCAGCERARAASYNLPYSWGGVRPQDVTARMANPYIARSFLDGWPTLHRLQNYSFGKLDPGDQSHRPIFKIDYLTVAWGFVDEERRYDEPLPPEIADIIQFNGDQVVRSTREFFVM